MTKRRIYYNKLVRDRIPEVIAQSNAECEIYPLKAREFEQALLTKVGEEASALPKVTSKRELIKKLADVADVIDVIEEIKTLKHISAAEITAVRKYNGRRLMRCVASPAGLKRHFA